MNQLYPGGVRLRAESVLAYLLALADMRGFDNDDKETPVLAHAVAGNDDA